MIVKPMAKPATILNAPRVIDGGREYDDHEEERHDDLGQRTPPRPTDAGPTDRRTEVDGIDLGSSKMTRRSSAASDGAERTG